MAARCFGGNVRRRHHHDCVVGHLIRGLRCRAAANVTFLQLSGGDPERCFPYPTLHLPNGGSTAEGLRESLGEGVGRDVRVP